jgi:hypothetical protein
MQTMTTEMGPRVKRGNNDDADYEHFLETVNRHFLAKVADGKTPLFKTDASGLWDAYLDSFPGEERQFHNCAACRHFIERYGRLVTIADDGSTAPALWDMADVPELYRGAFDKLGQIVRRAKVTTVFLSSLPVWGQPETGVWRHLALVPPASMLFKRARTTAGQAMAEKREDHGAVLRALVEFPLAAVDQALTLLKSDALYRSEKVLGQAQWLRDLHVAFEGAKGTRRTNVVWRAIALAPAGFCHPRSSMIGTLLEDIVAGLDFGDVSRKFAAKMSPLLYQRPQAAPSAGNIAQAEKVIAELGAAGSLARRYARLDEIETVWLPASHAEPASTGGVFGHLKPKDTQAVSPMTVPAQAITWEKFARAVLPEAKSLDLMAPSRGNFAALVTAENPEAPPMLQWDLPERRNPVSWYLYHGGSGAEQWGLRAGSWVRVNAVALQPSSWFGATLDHQGQGALFILEGAKDSRADSCGNALFPETMKAEFRGIRSTIESYSRGAKLGGVELASANGIKIGKADGAGAHVRVTLSNGTRVEYRIDRWD